MYWIKTLIPLVVVWLISFPLYAVDDYQWVSDGTVVAIGADESDHFSGNDKGRVRVYQYQQ